MNTPREIGLEWADHRVREAIEEENGGKTVAYMVIVRRCIAARMRAVEKQGRKAG